ncbi:hypothetical protein NC796_16940 [Aliifodinibius sp. S!AR15-10]|uniref:hypothetical protein n=1 Tax=Aliifodinibius sp. S!AR15-10 TaxID=2950437 RepID=UPI002864F0AE|nr:hypothetical protein [Aliifodinibius sp. S!AR15-10]MDR8392845.1 hypothetical protein [Aliifodinibius sp. S!AR15-10]
MDHFDNDSGTCARCGADENHPHPIYDFVVSLEPVENKKGVRWLCQECQLRVRAKRSRSEASDPENSTGYRKWLSKITKAVAKRSGFFL